MILTEEYRNQEKWRSWNNYIEKLPLKKDDLILDLGCSIGTVSNMFAKRVSEVIGIDVNEELLFEAKRSTEQKNVTFILHKLPDLDHAGISKADGIWCSFTAAYFPDFLPVLKHWTSYLKSGGWIATVEMSGLFDHEPLHEDIRKVFNDYYLQQRIKNLYDFEMGSKLEAFVQECGLEILHNKNTYDPELTFNGPADNPVLTSWENRFDRMHLFQEHLGRKLFLQVKTDFLNCLKSENHISRTLVKFIIAYKHGD
jgi:SAM-dependent methyltransferase